MKILLVNEKVRHPNVLPALGLALLAALAKQKGHQVKVIDYQITPSAPSLPAYVSYLHPDLVGLRIVNENWHAAREKILGIRAMVPAILVGGPFPTLHYEWLTTLPYLDYIFVGEAEEAWSQFLKNYPHIGQKEVKQPSPSHLSQVPLPDFSGFHRMQAIEYYPLQTSRGCPYNCTFCMTDLINSVQWRARPLSHVLAEVHQAVHSFGGLKGITVIDDNPTHNPARFTEFLHRYRDLFSYQQVPPLSVLNLRADKVTPEIASLLAECGCTQIILGVETVGARAMRLCHKRITPAKVRRAKAMLNTARIQVGGSFVIGLPGDDWRTVQQTIQFAQELDSNVSLWGHLLPFQGTPVRQFVTPRNDFAETMVAPNRGQIITQTGSETRELPEWWQIKGWLRANFKTNPKQAFASRWGLPQMLWHSIRYGEAWTFTREYGRWLAGKVNGNKKFSFLKQR